MRFVNPFQDRLRVVLFILGAVALFLGSAMLSFAHAQGLYAGKILSAPGSLWIEESGGGSIGQFASEIDALKRSGTMVVIDGLCLSACTMATSVRHVCATPRGILGFHQAWVPGPSGHIPAPDGTAFMASYWSPAAKAWVRRHGLRVDMQFVRADQIVPPCSTRP